MSNITLQPQPRIEKRWNKDGDHCWCVVYGDRVIGFGDDADGGEAACHSAIEQTYNWSTAFAADAIGYWNLTEAPILAPRYSFRVVIEQIDPEEARDFGTADSWAALIQKHLDAAMHLVNVVEVTPIRNAKR